MLSLTHSGTVRLVDRLAEAGLVVRESGADRRSRAVTLTDQGRQLGTQIAAARAGVLTGLLTGLSDAEQQTLHGLLGRLMAAAVQEKDGGAWICRLCDLRACGRPTGDCPAAAAARVKYGPPPS